jgi:hypothetical protein
VLSKMAHFFSEKDQHSQSRLKQYITMMEDKFIAELGHWFSVVVRRWLVTYLYCPVNI